MTTGVTVVTGAVVTGAVVTGAVESEVGRLRAENARLQAELEDFRAGYLRRTDLLLNVASTLGRMQAELLREVGVGRQALVVKE
jgi:hypothetical protein